MTFYWILFGGITAITLATVFLDGLVAGNRGESRELVATPSLNRLRRFCLATYALGGLSRIVIRQQSENQPI